ncbi:uncharacterized protein EI90DRAFT_2862878, partial [Cantharellus anzutake]|uniref:uncharacterized protein n=1 Tax=Cantharellus anzutake TaxID=1750568 RepID=UPI001902DF44
NCRTMWSIVCGCLLTAFACVWTAVHPDMRGLSHDIWPPKSRIGLMMLSLVLPEAILATAWYQFLVSWRIFKKYEMIKGWTLTHSYFVVMRGFLIRKTGNTREAAITKKEILDRSKGNAFSKFIIVLPLLWFITQYVGRWASHLYSSQLETMSLALFVYVLWWHKPVNIQFP